MNKRKILYNKLYKKKVFKEIKNFRILSIKNFFYYFFFLYYLKNFTPLFYYLTTIIKIK